MINVGKIVHNMEHPGNMDVGESMFMLILTNGTSAKANIS